MADNWPLFVAVIVLVVVLLGVRMYRQLQGRAQAHKQAMVSIAQKYDLALVLEDDSKISMKLSGVIEGVQVTLFSALKHRENGLSPVTQVTAMSTAQGGPEVHLIEDGFVGDEGVLEGLISRAVKDVLAQSS